MRGRRLRACHAHVGLISMAGSPMEVCVAKSAKTSKSLVHNVIPQCNFKYLHYSQNPTTTDSIIITEVS
jgi:hypothetical protein